MSRSSPTDPHISDPFRVEDCPSLNHEAPLLTSKGNEPEPDLINWLKENSVPIIGVASIGLLVCAFGRYSSISVDWTKAKDFTDAFRNVTQGLEFFAGGIWA